MNRKRVALYARVSTKDKGQDNENQLRDLRVFAAHMGWELVGEYVDKATGKRSDGKTRPQFEAMMLAAYQRKFDVLLFWALDRVSREGVLDTLTHLKRLSDYGVSFRSYQEQYVDSAGEFKDAIIGFLSAIAKQEAVRLSERTKAGLAKAKAEAQKDGVEWNIGRPKVEDNPTLMRQFRRLHSAGTSVRKMAYQIGISPTTVQKLIALES